MPHWIVKKYVLTLIHGAGVPHNATSRLPRFFFGKQFSMTWIFLNSWLLSLGAANKFKLYGQYMDQGDA